MRIAKFGGSSVSSPDRIRNVINIVKEKNTVSPVAVVVSAFGGVTDTLIKISEQAVERNALYEEHFLQLKLRHFEAAESLIAKKYLSESMDCLHKFFEDLGNVLQGLYLIQELSKRSLDFIMSFGERLSAYIISQAMKEAMPSSAYLDARSLVKTDGNFGSARPLYGQTYHKIRQYFDDHPGLHVITGFIGSTEHDETTTLGRGGSDFTASLFGAALRADEIEIWTDVDGVLTSDPRIVRQSFRIPHMTYKEAMEISFFGAKVIYSPTITPAYQHNIPLRIKNTFNPHGEGTLIDNNPHNHNAQICGISCIDDVALIGVEGSGMVGTTGISKRVFSTIAMKQINVILITQCSSEHSISFAVIPESGIVAKNALEEEFSLERKAGMIDEIAVEKGLSIIAVVGENMRKNPGVAGTLFNALWKNGINTVAMAQGSSQLNISVVIHKEDVAKALNVIHEEFFQTTGTTTNVCLVGTGLIGSTLLKLLSKHYADLLRNQGLDIRLTGLANSQQMYFEAKGIPLDNWKAFLQSEKAEKMDLNKFIRRINEMNLPNSIFVDCTASEEVAKSYQQILESHISIITPNKLANSSSYATFKTLKDLTLHKGIKFLYSTNVGAGLPILNTIHDLLSSGDKIHRIEAILSGTISYLFNTFDETHPFSQVVKDAQSKGYTEPDPREDLKGLDMARKLLILARESGYPLELHDINIEPLLPENVMSADSLDAFYRKLKDCDQEFEVKRQEALKQGKLLRYMGSFQKGDAEIKLQRIDANSPFYNLSGCDNIIALTTDRYKETPLIIRGQGAGAEVTAGQVLADLIKLANG